MTEIVQVEAVGIAFAHGALTPAETSSRARMEAAMIQAVEAAQAEGIGDPEIIRARILAARDAVMVAL